MSMKPKYNRYDFLVTGQGIFPIDMLRYDHCWPHGQEDAAKIDITLGSNRSREQRSVKITGVMYPTAERWQSFGWSVSDITGRRVL